MISPFLNLFEDQFQRLFQIVCGAHIAMPPYMSPLKQYWPDPRAGRSHHIGVVGIPNVNNLTWCTDADSQSFAKYFPAGLVGLGASTLTTPAAFSPLCRKACFSVTQM